jgi:hypothetical protein
MVMGVSYGKPMPVPPLGRRVLPWHVAGAFDSRDDDVWNSLATYASALDSEDRGAEKPGAIGWVEIRNAADGTLQVRAGLRDRTYVNVALSRKGQGLWTYKSHVYECAKGGIVIVGAFPPPPAENPYGMQTSGIGAEFTFYPASDGSLVALEEAYTGVTGGNMIFNKWWRWRRMD